MQNLTDKNWRLNTLKVISCLAIFFLLAFQPGEYHLIKSIPLSGSFLTTDKFGNGYVVHKENELLKIGTDGIVLSTFNNNKFGPISFVGTNNPLKLLVFYPDFATIILLDNTLSMTGMINLHSLGLSAVSAACIALDNNIWIYDAINYKLKKIDDKLNVILESEDLTTLLGETPKPNFLIETDNNLYLNDTAIGILVFDIYGTYYKTIPLKGLKDFQKFQEKIIYFQSGELKSYNLNTVENEKINLPQLGATAVRIEKDRLFLLNKDTLDLYSY